MLAVQKFQSNQSRKIAAFLFARNFVGPQAANGFGNRGPQSGAPSRLVKGSKFPTHTETLDFAAFEWTTGEVFNESGIIPTISEAITEPEKFATRDSNAYSVLSYQAWSDTYKLRPVIEAKKRMKPTPQSGARCTLTLTPRGRLAIDQSARYLATRPGEGYTTMITLTLTPEARERTAYTITDDGEIIRPAHSLQQEASRFFDAAKMLYKRGFRYGLFGKEEGRTDKLRYLWVAENPKNDQGEDNPHIHVLLSWEVPREAFQEWTRRLEKIWGQGFAHIERLRQPEAAGAYVLKAAKYVGGKEKGEQGAIFGNRYFISADARAPGFDCVSIMECGQLPLLIAGAREHQDDTLKNVRRVRKAARQQDAKKWVPHARKKGIKTVLKKCAALLEGRAIIPGKWQILFKGMSALTRFIGWAAQRGEAPGCNLLPEKPNGIVWVADERTDKTIDVKVMWNLIHEWKRAMKMPRFDEADLWHQREHYEQWEPVWA